MEKKWYAADTAVMMGDITVAENVSVWHHATLRADTAALVIGKDSNVQDNVCIHAGDGYPVILGEQVTIGHSAVIHGCTIDDNTIVGMGAIVLNGAHIGKNCLIGAGALITQGMEIPEGSLAFGNPAKVRRLLSEEEIAHNKKNALHYIEAGREQLIEKDVKMWNESHTNS